MNDAQDELCHPDAATPANPVRMSNGLVLFDWQNEAIQKWVIGDDEDRNASSRCAVVATKK